MIRINLIPHRAEYRNKQITEYIVVFLMAVFATVAIIIILDLWATQDLTTLQEEQATLKTRNSELSKKIGELRNLDTLRKDVEGKLQIVDELQAGRFRSLNSLNAIAESIPQNVWIDQLDDNDGNILLSGFGESSKAVANFMRAIDLSTVFADVNLQYDQEHVENENNIRKFILSFRRLTLAEIEANKTKKVEGGSNEL